MDVNERKVRSVCVYCASSTKVDSCYFEAASALGRALAGRGINVINGAGGMGLMRALSDSALATGGTVTGVIPRFMVEQGWQHDGLTELIVTGDMHERKSLMASMSDGVIALPGGCGTMEELLEIITWKQLGLYLKPIVVFDVGGFYDPLFAMLERAVQRHFMREQHRALWTVATSADEAVEMLYSTPDWDANLRKFAAI